MPQLIQMLTDTGHLDTVNAGIEKAARMLIDRSSTKEELTWAQHTAVEQVKESLAKYRVVANHRAQGRSGLCSLSKKTIELHGKLFEEGREGPRDSTLLHEVAHAITYILTPHAKGHGAEWKAVMRCLGRPARRTTNTDDYDYSFIAESRKKAAKLIYACQKCELELPAQRKKKYPVEVYTHTGCGGKLYLKENRVTRQTFPNPRAALAA